MLSAIELDDKLMRWRGEIGDVRPDRMLSSKSEFRNQLTQRSPEPSFGVGRFAPQASGNLRSGSERPHSSVIFLSKVGEEGELAEIKRRRQRDGGIDR
jgi:hypothetical protein